MSILKRILLLLIVIAPRALFAHGDVHGQILEITDQIAKSPTNFDLFTKRGELYRVHQDWDAAHADFDHAFALNPKLDTIDFSKGRLFLDANWPLSAKVSFDRFLTKYSNHVEALVLRARALATLEEMLVPLYLHHRYQLEASAKSIGGLDYTYAVKENGSVVPQPVRKIVVDERPR